MGLYDIPSDCPGSLDSETIIMSPLSPNATYHGTFGGTDGIPAQIGDEVFFGTYFFDFLGDNTWENAPFQTIVPLRDNNPTPGVFGATIQHTIKDSKWGPG